MTDQANPNEPATGGEDERVPAMQRLLDNPFLLLFLGVTVPTSTKPAPRANNGANTSASLSNPAAMPIGVGKSRFQTRVAKLGVSSTARPGNKPDRSATIAARCAVSGGSKRNSAVAAPI